MLYTYSYVLYIYVTTGLHVFRVHLEDHAGYGSPKSSPSRPLLAMFLPFSVPLESFQLQPYLVPPPLEIRVRSSLIM